jgi:hypothetical protein
MNLVRPNRPHISHLGCFSSIRLILNLWELQALLLYKQRGIHFPQGFYTFCHFPVDVKLAFPGAFDFRHANNVDSKDLRWQTVLPLMYSIVAYFSPEKLQSTSLSQERKVRQYPYVIRRWGNGAHYCMIMMGRRRRREIAGYIEEISQILNYNLSVMFCLRHG